jgi:Bacterial protein of unknown function (DUF922)
VRRGQKVVLWLVTAALGAHVDAQQPRAPAPEPFAWAADRRLTFSDFLGKPDITHAAAALTVYAMSVTTGCDGEFFRFGVTSIFQPQRSWVKPAMMFRSEDGERLLHHEQTHFDLSEVHARRLRKTLGEVTDPCNRPASEIDAIVRKAVLEDAAVQSRYDRDTSYGLDVRQQGRWDDDVAKQLKALAAYVH